MGYEMFRMISLYKASFCNNFMNAKGKKRKKIKSTSTIIDIDKEEKEMELMLGRIYSSIPQYLYADNLL